MSINLFTQVPYLRTSRNFPEDLHQLTVEVNKSYVDIANCVNNRTMSIFTTQVAVVNGESWFINGIKHQGFRATYQIGALSIFPASIPHFINFSNLFEFVRCFGSYTDGTNYYGAIYGSNVAIAGQISFYLTPNSGTTPGDIVILAGAGAPTVINLVITLEWIALV